MTEFTVFAALRTSCNRTLLLLLVYLVTSSFGEYELREPPPLASVAGDRTGADNDFRSCTDGKCIKRTTHQVTSGMWFGPRLGRRRRSDQKAEIVPNLEALANLLDGTRWAVITIPGGEKRQPTQFTPRLGRESAEESSLYAADHEEIEPDEQIYPPLFAPRLGRRVPWKPSPRLGRQLHSPSSSSSVDIDRSAPGQYSGQYFPDPSF